MDYKEVSEKKYPLIPSGEIANDFHRLSNTMQECRREGFLEGIKWLLDSIWHKRDDNPGNKHPFPVINPDTQEMAFAYYEYGWQFDRSYNGGPNMLWLDIEKILPFDL